MQHKPRMNFSISLTGTSYHPKRSRSASRLFCFGSLRRNNAQGCRLAGSDGHCRQKGTFVDKARKNAHGVYGVADSAFTVIKLSNYDIDVFTPIVDPPRVKETQTRLGMERLTVVDSESAWRSMMRLGVTFDHHALYGEPVAEMIRTLTGEQPVFSEYLPTTSSRAPYDNSETESSDSDAITT